MKTFKQYHNTLTYDDWGSDSDNNNAITEAGLSRIIQKVKSDQEDFIIITAYRGEFDKKENIKRNRTISGFAKMWLLMMEKQKSLQKIWICWQLKIL